MPGLSPSYGQPYGQPASIPTYRSWQPGFMPLRPLQLGDFLSLPMKAIQFNRAVIIGGPLLCTLVMLVTLSLAIWLLMIDWYDEIRYGLDFTWPTAQTIVAIVIAFLVYILADAAARVFVIPAVSRGILGQRITLARAWEATRPRVLHVLLLYLLVGLMGVGAIVVIFLFGGLLIAGGATPLFALIILGLIPFIFMATVVVGVAVTVVVLERSSASAALRRAYSLVKGSAWRLTGNILVIQLVVWIISQIVSSVSTEVMNSAADSATSVAALAGVLVFTAWFSLLISAILTYSFVGTVTTLMYVDLRIRKEGFDIDLARAAEAAARR